MLWVKEWQPVRDWGCDRCLIGRAGSRRRRKGTREIGEAEHVVNTGESYRDLLVCFYHAR